LIVADENVRIERVIKRDSMNEALVRERIKNQLTDEQKIRMVDYIIENNNRQLLIPCVIELDKLLKKD
jgi:dephospho-CoA kinase